MKKEELREFLINHLDRAIVPYKNWNDRDTPAAQERQATMRMYLKAGCDFKLMKDYNKELSEDEVSKYLEENHKRMYISIFHYEFEDEGSWDTGYSPHPKFLEICIAKGNKDWY